MVDLREVIDDETIEFDEPSRKMRTGRRVPMQTVAPLDLYVDPVSGSDANTGLTQSDPLLTLEKADSLIPLWCLHPVVVHLKGETYPLPSRGYFLRSRVTVFPIRVFADEAWDSSVYTQIATGVADVGTGQLVVTVVGGGLTIDVWRNETIEFVDGAAAGFRQDVRDNTADDVIPSAGWDTGLGVAIPASGDNFRIFKADGCVFEAPAGGPEAGTYKLSQPMLGGSVSVPGSNVGGVFFEGFRLTTVNSTSSWGQFSVSGLVYMFGMTGTASLSSIPIVVGAPGELRLGNVGEAFETGALAPYAMYRGWGFRCENRTCRPLANARCDGFLNMEALSANISIDEEGFWRVRGGRVGRVFNAPDFAKVQFESDFGATKILSTPSPSVFYKSSKFSVLRGCDLDVRLMGAAILFSGWETRGRLDGDGAVLATRGTPGDTVVEVRGGAQLLILGSPEGIGASTPGVPVSDWLIDGVTIDAVALLTADGDRIVGTNGSEIRRQG